MMKAFLPLRMLHVFQRAVPRPVLVGTTLAGCLFLLATTEPVGRGHLERHLPFSDSLQVIRLAGSVADTVADTVVVFGPKRLDATGAASALHVEVPALPLRAGLRYLLRLDNGAADGSRRVSSAMVRLDGVKSIDEMVLHEGAARAQREVRLRGHDTLTVNVEGPEESYVVLSILTVASPTFTVFGPQTYGIVPGEAKTFDTTFTKPADGAPVYTLLVTNGSPDSSNRVSSGEIRLNDTIIVHSSDLSQDVGSLTLPVSLADDNALRVKLGGSTGNHLTIEFTATDTTPPNLTVTAPADSLLTRDTSVAVTGSVADRTATTVTVAGQAATLDGSGGWSATAPLVEGANSITVVATDGGGNTTDATRIVMRDHTSPALSVSAPVDGLVTKDTAVTVSGTAVDPNGVEVSLNGVPLILGTGGTFTGTQALTEGVNYVSIVAEDAVGNNVTVMRSVIRDTEAPVLTVTEPLDGATTEADTILVHGTVTDATAVTVTADGVTLGVDADGAFGAKIALAIGENTLTVTAIDAAANDASVVRTVIRSPIDTAPPPDPAIVATPIDPTVTTGLASSTAFLYTGADPIQTGVAPGTIEPMLAGVLRGKVLTRDGQPLPGATVRVLSHPEFGQTLSRADGMFDLAVNGGGQLTINYEKQGYLPLQRQVEVPWQQFAQADSVVLIPIDSQVTTIDFTDPVEVARGSVVADSDGVRQATLLFEQGTSASMVLPDGSVQPLPSINVRATEYTVGPMGPAAMPAALPPTTAYTYAAELSVDEALAAGATEVQFSKPVAFYVENFLGFPVGTRVPLGSYDREAGDWKAEPDGLVVEIVSVTDGRADVDVYGTGQPATQATLDSLGISDSERQELAALYSPGQTVWRTEHSHFTSWDWNWSYWFPPKADLPKADVKVDDPQRCENQRAGSIIGCESQSLGEVLPILGTGLGLRYASGRTIGNVYARSVLIPGQTRVDTAELTPARRLRRNEFPSHVFGIRYRLQVAGQTIETGWMQPDDFVEPVLLTWDGRDAYGRLVNGKQHATLTIEFGYNGNYGVSGGSGGSSFGGFGGGAVALDPLRGRLSLRTVWTGELGVWQARGQELGGWSITAHHAYDPVGRLVYRGDGGLQVGASFLRTITTVAGIPGESGYTGDGGPAIEAKIGGPYGLAVASDGSIYVPVLSGPAVRKISPDGIITKVAGGQFGTGGDGGPATAAALMSPRDLAIGPDGSIYIVDNGAHNVRRVDPAGIITTFAGGGTTRFNCGFASDAGVIGDGGPAAAASLSSPSGIAVGPDGSVYIADTCHHRVRRVGPDGIISTVAGMGGCAGGPLGDGGPATDALLCQPYGVAVAPDGRVFISQPSGPEPDRVRVVGVDGIIQTYAGQWEGFGGDGGPATSAGLFGPLDLAVSRAGDLYIVDHHNSRIRRVSPDGIITTFAGARISGQLVPPRGDGGLATQADIADPRGVAVGPNGDVFISEYGTATVRRVAPAMPGFSDAQVMVASEDGSEVYQFTEAGRHLRTVAALSGDTLLSFAYDTAGRLTSITDASQNVVSIERDADGTPTTLVAPFGQRTQLSLDTAGYLGSITNPAGERTLISHANDGLLDSLITPRGHIYRFTYDSVGRLTGDDDPAGGSQTLTRIETDSGYVVEVTTALGRGDQYAVEHLSDESVRRTKTDPAGQAAVALIGVNGTVTSISPDSTVTVLTEGADPRFGSQTPIARRLVVRLPSGDSSVVTTSRGVTRADPGDLFSVTKLIDSIGVNGRTFVTTSEPSAGTWLTSVVSPEGRVSVSRADSVGRILMSRTAGLDSVVYHYDTRGRLERVQNGGRFINYTYDALGRLATTTDPLGRTDSLFYDGADRLIRRALPGGRDVQFAYDSAGNLTMVIPPGRTAHTFGHTPIELTDSYTPPSVGGGAWATSYHYNVDRALTAVLRPGGDSIAFVYDTAGRPSGVTFERGGAMAQLTFGYSPTTGRLAGIAAQDGSGLSFAYDGMLLTSVAWTGPVAGNVGVTYNADFQLASRTVNAAHAVSFGYDNDGLLVTAGLLGLQRRIDNGLLSRDSVGAVKGNWSFTSRGELAGYTASFDTATLFQTSYARDSVGRITTLAEAIQSTVDTLGFSYDSAGRLWQVYRNGVLTASYEYDLNGNRERVVTPGGTVTSVYDAQDRLVSYGATTYRYTANGELRTKVSGSDTTRYSYDALGNLMAVGLPGGIALEYVIDGQNRRIGKRVNGVLVQGFLYGSQLAPVAELDGAGQVVSRFVYATRRNVPDYMVKGGQTYRLVLDHLGSVRLVVNTADGSVAQRLDYDAYGRVMQNTNPGFQPFGFAGGLLDGHTGLVRFGARDYDAETGRWTRKDPTGFGGGYANLYVYVDNDPVNYIDPTGLQAIGFNLPLGQGAGQEATDYWAQQAIDPTNSWWEQAGAEVAGHLSALWTPDTWRETAGTLAGGYLARVIGPFSPRGLPRYVARLRKYIRFDPPHHGKPWHWDGDLAKWLQNLRLSGFAFCPGFWSGFFDANF